MSCCCAATIWEEAEGSCRHLIEGIDIGVAGHEKSGDDATTKLRQVITVSVVDFSQDAVGS